MDRLRHLGASDPELTLRLARQGTLDFPRSDASAERAWFIVKSLSDLGRHDEARAEARIMVETYRGTPWAVDVERHTLVHPPGPPGGVEQPH